MNSSRIRSLDFSTSSGIQGFSFPSENTYDRSSTTLSNRLLLFLVIRRSVFRVIGHPGQRRKQPFHDRHFMPGLRQLQRHRLEAMNPPSHVHDGGEPVVELRQARIEKIVVGIADVAAKPPRRTSSSLMGVPSYGSIRQNVTGRQPSPTMVRRKAEVLAHRFERARRVEEHEPVFPHQVDALQEIRPPRGSARP